MYKYIERRVTLKNVKKALGEFKESKKTLPKSFDSHLENIKVTKEELEQLKEHYKEYPEYFRDREIGLFNIKKKLQVVLNEKALHDNIDEAIKFLNELLK